MDAYLIFILLIRLHVSAPVAVIEECYLRARLPYCIPHTTLVTCREPVDPHWAYIKSRPQDHPHHDPQATIAECELWQGAPILLEGSKAMGCAKP